MRQDTNPTNTQYDRVIYLHMRPLSHSLDSDGISYNAIPSNEGLYAARLASDPTLTPLGPKGKRQVYTAQIGKAQLVPRYHLNDTFSKGLAKIYQEWVDGSLIWKNKRAEACSQLKQLNPSSLLIIELHGDRNGVDFGDEEGNDISVNELAQFIYFMVTVENFTIDRPLNILLHVCTAAMSYKEVEHSLAARLHNRVAEINSQKPLHTKISACTRKTGILRWDASSVQNVPYVAITPYGDAYLKKIKTEFGLVTYEEDKRFFRHTLNVADKPDGEPNMYGSEVEISYQPTETGIKQHFVHRFGRDEKPYSEVHTFELLKHYINQEVVSSLYGLPQLKDHVDDFFKTLGAVSRASQLQEIIQALDPLVSLSAKIFVLRLWLHNEVVLKRVINHKSFDVSLVNVPGESKLLTKIVPKD